MNDFNRYSKQGVHVYLIRAITSACSELLEVLRKALSFVLYSHLGMVSLLSPGLLIILTPII